MFHKHLRLTSSKTELIMFPPLSSLPHLYKLHHPKASHYPSETSELTSVSFHHTHPSHVGSFLTSSLCVPFPVSLLLLLYIKPSSLTCTYCNNSWLYLPPRLRISHLPPLSLLTTNYFRYWSSPTIIIAMFSQLRFSSPLKFLKTQNLWWLFL